MYVAMETGGDSFKLFSKWDISERKFTEIVRARGYCLQGPGQISQHNAPGVVPYLWIYGFMEKKQDKKKTNMLSHLNLSCQSNRASTDL